MRPPTALWGYNVQVTDDALERIAAAIRERDVRIVALEQRLADLTGDEHYAPVPPPARHARRAATAVAWAPPETPVREETHEETRVDTEEKQEPEPEPEPSEADEPDE
jgi:hypothetical protein